MIKYLQTSTIDFLPLNNKEAHNCLRTYRHQKNTLSCFPEIYDSISRCPYSTTKYIKN